jgi:putative membrane protein
MTFQYWDFAPSVMIGTVFFVTAYMLLTGPLRRPGWGPPVPWPQQLSFFMGTLCMFLALIGPLDGIGDEYLFSAHMAQHMLLSFAAPPLWVIGMPDWLIRRLVPSGILSWMVNPFTAFLLFNGVMWTWHLPSVYDAALEHEWLHILEHLLFMSTGTICWLPLLKSNLADRMTPSLKLMYLFPSMLSCTALAALMTFSAIQLYPFYGNASLGWGLTPLGDQQLGGLAMWLPGDMVYMALIVWSFRLLLDQTEEGQQVKI